MGIPGCCGTHFRAGPFSVNACLLFVLLLVAVCLVACCCLSCCCLSCCLIFLLLVAASLVAVHVSLGACSLLLSSYYSTLMSLQLNVYDFPLPSLFGISNLFPFGCCIHLSACPCFSCCLSVFLLLLVRVSLVACPCFSCC